MWSALALTTALTCAAVQDGDLKLTNIRPTMGVLGPPRKDADNPRLLIGDAIFLSFDIEGLKVGPDGVVKYSIGMELRNDKDKLLYREEPQALEAINSLGGDRVPAFVATQTGTDTVPGFYTLKAIVKDLAAGKQKEHVAKFEVVPATFGLVRMHLSYDEKGALPAPPICVAGQRLTLHFFATGFERTNKQPNISLKMRISQDGKSVLEKDPTGTIKDAPETHKMIYAYFPIFLNRGGKYTVEIEGTDEVSKKTTKQSFDITVYELK